VDGGITIKGGWAKWWRSSWVCMR